MDVLLKCTLVNRTMSAIKKLGIVAGGGDIPFQLVEYCQKNQIDFFVVALKSHASKKLVNKDIPHVWARLGDIGHTFQKLKEEEVREIVLIGNVKRPSLSEIRPDWEGVKIIAKLAKKALGDDGLLRAVIEEIEERGFKVIGVDKIMPDLVASNGVYGKYAPNKDDMIDIERGITIAKELGALDVGQGVVVQERLVLAVEAIEGTDAMISRAGALKRNGRKPILIKMKKPNQDFRVDLPTIGEKTVEEAAKAGFGGIAIQAGSILLVNRHEVIKKANAAKMFIIGMEFE